MPIPPVDGSVFVDRAYAPGAEISATLDPALPVGGRMAGGAISSRTGAMRR